MRKYSVNQYGVETVSIMAKPTRRNEKAGLFGVFGDAENVEDGEERKVLFCVATKPIILNGNE